MALGEVADVDAGQAHDAVVTAHGVAGPHRGRQRVELGAVARDGAGRVVGGQDVGVTGPGRVGAGHGSYIRSGAETPSRPRPEASTVRVASHRARRAVCRGPASSSPWGSTRQVS